MQNRANALKAQTRHIGNLGTDGDVVIKRDRAAIIRTMLGSKQTLKAGILNTLRASTTLQEHLAAMCSYICGILEWTDMASVILIRDTLLLTDSPVLEDPHVAQEALNFDEVYLTINSTDAPQYFRILNPPSVTRIIDRSRFPMLLALTQACRDALYSTVRRSINPTSSENPLVTELVEKHNRHLRQTLGSQVDSAINYLTDFSSNLEQDDDVDEAEGWMANAGNGDRRMDQSRSGIMTSDTCATRAILGDEEVEFVKLGLNTSGVDVEKTISWCIYHCNSNRYLDDAEGMLTDLQICAYYLSAICAVFSGLHNVC